jgi:ribonuclease D
VIYEFLSAQLKKNGRADWVAEELSLLTDPATYTVNPDEAWQRIKTRTTSGRFLAVVKALAKFRETTLRPRTSPAAG